MFGMYLVSITARLCRAGKQRLMRQYQQPSLKMRRQRQELPCSSAHRDHTHGVPATWAATAHNLLSTSHGDTLAGSVADGDIIIGNGTPKWSRLGISIPNSTFINLVGVGYGETRPSWKPAFDATVPSTINWSDAAAAGSATVFARRDHVHGAPANPGLTAHGLISATHNDTTGTGFRV